MERVLSEWVRGLVGVAVGVLGTVPVGAAVRFGVGAAAGGVVPDDSAAGLGVPGLGPGALGDLHPERRRSPG